MVTYNAPHLGVHNHSSLFLDQGEKLIADFLPDFVILQFFVIHLPWLAEAIGLESILFIFCLSICLFVCYTSSNYTIIWNVLQPLKQTNEFKKIRKFFLEKTKLWIMPEQVLSHSLS